MIVSNHRPILKHTILMCLLLMSLLMLMGLNIANIANAETIRVAGSSTVFPFSTVVAEQIGRKTGTPPIVESTGSGSGLRSICKKDVDIANSSRRIKASEVKNCQDAGIGIIEFLVGRDGIVLAVNNDNTQFESISLEQLYRALAKQIYIDGTLADNPYQKWSDISADLPNVDILVYGPPPTSGTRDALETLGLKKGALKIAELAKLEQSDEKQFEKLATSLREDGIYVEGGENDNLLIRKLSDATNAIAIFGFSYLDSNRSTIRGVQIDGIAPEFDNIVDGLYGLARPLYFYVRQDRWALIQTQNYVKAFVSEDAIGEDGYLLDKGLVPLIEDEWHLQQQQATTPTTLTVDALR